MSRGYDDEDAGFADLQPAESMDQSYIADFEIGQRLRGQFLHLFERHGFVEFVVEVEGLAAPSVVADNALEDCCGAVFRALEGIGDGCGFDWVTHNSAMWAAGGCTTATGDGREECDFVPRFEDIRGTREFLVNRHGDARQVLLELRRVGRVVIQQIREGGALRQVECLDGPADEGFQNAEEEDTDMHECYWVISAMILCFANWNNITITTLAPAKMSQRKPRDCCWPRPRVEAIDPPSTRPVNRPPRCAELLMPGTAAPNSRLYPANASRLRIIELVCSFGMARFPIQNVVIRRPAIPKIAPEAPAVTASGCHARLAMLPPTPHNRYAPM